VSIIAKNEFARGRRHINGIESFWSYAKTRLGDCVAFAPIPSFPTLKKRNGASITGVITYTKSYSKTLSLPSNLGKTLEKIPIVSNPERAAEASGGKVGLRPVVVNEDPAITAVAKKSAAQFADFCGRLQPA
jgi:hypothetical protein